eukprot:8471104-Alexandrium_andersonii.AAC.1
MREWRGHDEALLPGPDGDVQDVRARRVEGGGARAVALGRLQRLHPRYERRICQGLGPACDA